MDKSVRPSSQTPSTISATPPHQSIVVNKRGVGAGLRAGSASPAHAVRSNSTSHAFSDAGRCGHGHPATNCDLGLHDRVERGRIIVHVDEVRDRDEHELASGAEEGALAEDP